MKVDFKRLTWENYPSTETPINADNLNRLEEGVAGLYSDVSEIQEELGEGVGEYVTDWLDEHVTPGGSTIVVDDTLTIQGAAADAKKTGDEISSVKDGIDYYLNGVDASYPITGGASNRIEFPFLKDAIYTITNNTDNNCWNLKVFKRDGTNTVIDSTFSRNESVTYIPTTNDIIAFGGWFDGTGTVSVKCNYKGLQVDITPELFGAAANGSTNDATAINTAINYCITNNVPLHFSKGKTYAVGSQIRITNPPQNFHIYGNGAIIKALSGYSLSAYAYMLYFTKSNNTGYAVMNRFYNFTVDTNNVCAGIDIDYGYDFTFENVSVLGCKTTAIYAEHGGEVYFNHISIKCTHNSGNSTGLQIVSSDYHFTDVNIIDADRAIYNASSSMYTRVHAWNTADCAGTYFMVHNAGYPIMVQCHADTYETGYYRETDRPLMLIGCVFYINSNLYDSSATPVVFKFASASLSYSGNIKCVDCMFDAHNSTVDMTVSAHRIQLINCSKKGTINRFYNGVSLSLSNGVLDSGLTLNRNTITQDGNKMAVNLVLDVSAITFDGSAKTIGSVPLQRFYPSAFVVYPCWFCNDDWGTNYISGYISINNSNGVVQVKPNTAGAYKKLVADFYYDKPLGLYEP